MGASFSVFLNHDSSWQVFGRKKSATAVAYCKRGKGLIKVKLGVDFRVSGF